jgi:chromosome segregation ATPase
LVVTLVSYGWRARGQPEIELLESQLRVREDRIDTAGDKVRALWHDIAAYEQELSEDLATLRHEYGQQPDLDADAAAAALRRDLTPTLQAMETAVAEVETYFRDEGIVDTLRNWEHRMTRSAAEQTYNGYNGRTAAAIVDEFKADALDYRAALRAARNEIEAAKKVQDYLPAHLREDAVFDPVTVEESSIKAAPEPADDNQYGRDELEAALMEAYGRYLKEEHGRYDAAQDRVQEMIATDMADWVAP